MSLDDVRASVKRIRPKAESSSTASAKDATALVAPRSEGSLVDDARKRATEAAAELDAQRERVCSARARRARQLAEQAIARVRTRAARTRWRSSKRRVDELERRIERVTQGGLTLIRRATPGGAEAAAARRLDAQPIARPHASVVLAGQRLTSAAAHRASRGPGARVRRPPGP